mmetsp:Transcript_22892/g.68810  ORF Transcript_22892/g.68810 Transcript_22892/m.68810 type:complete len:205 (+) Transcript_22892:161-775(+)
MPGSTCEMTYWPRSCAPGPRPTISKSMRHWCARSVRCATHMALPGCASPCTRQNGFRFISSWYACQPAFAKLSLMHLTTCSSQVIGAVPASIATRHLPHASCDIAMHADHFSSPAPAYQSLARSHAVVFSAGSCQYEACKRAYSTNALAVTASGPGLPWQYSSILSLMPQLLGCAAPKKTPHGTASSRHSINAQIWPVSMLPCA